jgi:hypothetical protein
MGKVAQTVAKTKFIKSSTSMGQGKPTYTFSAERQRLSAFHSPPPRPPACWLLASGGKRNVTGSVYVDLPARPYIKAQFESLTSKTSF